MGKYQIQLVELPYKDTSCSSRLMEAGIGIKEAFWDNNLSIYCCIAMILGKDLNKARWKSPHVQLYGMYLGGFIFEGFDKLPPLCILNVLSVGIPYNAVYYNGTIYDPRTGIFTVKEYAGKFIKILSYIQIFLEEAYGQVEWKPAIPEELRSKLDKEEGMKNFFFRLSSMQQSKIINCIYPFSKPSSLLEKRESIRPLTTKQVGKIIGHISYLYQLQAGSNKSVGIMFEDQKGADEYVDSKG